VEESEITRT